jgi:hypothetical protein
MLSNRFKLARCQIVTQSLHHLIADAWHSVKDLSELAKAIREAALKNYPDSDYAPRSFAPLEPKIGCGRRLAKNGGSTSAGMDERPRIFCRGFQSGSER